jgi:hypothetical protein
MEQRTFNIKIHGIDLIEKALYKVSVSDKEVFNYETKCQIVMDVSKELVVCFVHIVIKKFETSEDAAKMFCGFGYNIDSFASFDKDETGNYIIPQELDNMLKMISISTMRGLLFSEFRGTQLHSAILPIIIADTLVPAEGTLIEARKPN